MRQNSNIETKVGIFLLLGIALVCTLIIIFGEVPDFFKPTYSVTVRFPDASGLLKGSDVFLSGAVIGKVTSDPQYIPAKEKVEVTMKINKDVGIRKDATYLIGSAGLLGDKFVVVKPAPYKEGGDTSEYLKDGDVIEGITPTGLDEIMQSSKPLIDKANDIADQLDEMIRKLNLDVFSGTSTDDLKETISKLREMVDNGDSFISNANDLLAQAKTGQGLIGRLINDKKTADDFSGLLSQTRTGKGMLPVLLNDKESGDKLKELISNLKAHGVVFYHDDYADAEKSDDGSRKKK